MGHSRADKARSRERILTNASTRIREVGLDGVSVGELMKSANLTHGGFYGHFDSRSSLIAAALDRAISDGEAAATAGERGKGSRSVKSVVNGYLSPVHRDNPGSGCAIAALAADAARAEPEVRSIMAGKLERYLDNMAKVYGDGPEADEFASGAWSTMIGAVILSRVFAGTPRSDEILAQARRAILRLEEAMREQPEAAA